MITASDFRSLIDRLGDVAKDDIEWSENIEPPTNSTDFALEAIFVICNSGMKHTVARGIYDRVTSALQSGVPVFDVFKHPGKAEAIEYIWGRRDDLLKEFIGADDKLAYCGSLPWIGEITKYHLAKNFGVDCAKPDVHLQRLADREGKSVSELCESLAADTGYRIATVDLILWRACATGLLDSRTGEIRQPVEGAQETLL